MFKLEFVGKILNRFSTKIWDPNKKELLGKSSLTWAKVIMSYLIFYAVFACFFAICMKIFLNTLGNEAPTMVNMMSLLKNNPGMNFEPQATQISALIRFGKPYNESVYVERLDTVFYTYRNSTNNGTNKFCSEDAPVQRTGPACSFNTSTLGKYCLPSNRFGYADERPCVMLRINRIYGWDPKSSDLAKLACTKRLTSPGCEKLFEFQDIPSSRKTFLKPGFVPVSCQGQNPGDEDSILKVIFFPPHGFPSHHYPYFNQPGFQSPAVMVQFHLVPGTAVMIWCKLWTGQIKHDLLDQQGSVRFEMIVNSNTTIDAFVRNVTSYNNTLD